MNCKKCNTELTQDAVVCANCEEPMQESTTQHGFEEAVAQDLDEGTPTHSDLDDAVAQDLNEVPIAAVQEPQNSTPEPNNPEKAPKKAGWKIIIPAAVVAFVIGYFAATTLFNSSNISTALSVGAAFENWGDEMGERIENSPFAAVMMLEDILEDGSLTVDFVHSTGQGFGMFNTRGSVTMLSHMETDETAFLMDVSMGGFLNIDLDIFLNTERIAARSNMLGDTFYGITFNTFRNDIREFGPLVGLTNAEMNELADIVEAFVESLDNPMFADPDEYIAPYIELFVKFAMGWDMESRDDQISVNGTNVDVTMATFTIRDRDISTFLHDLYTLLQNDEALREYINLQDSMQGFGGGSMYDEFLDEFLGIIEEFSETITGHILVELAISNDNRLINSTKTVDISVDGEPIHIVAIMDLGLSVTDDWTLKIITDDETFDIAWAFGEVSGVFENKLSFGDDTETFSSVTSEWTPETGRFTLSFEEYATQDSGSFSGVLTIDDYSFDFSFDDNIDIGGGESISIGISGALGANIEHIEYINLDEWDADLIEMIFDLMNFF